MVPQNAPIMHLSDETLLFIFEMTLPAKEAKRISYCNYNVPKDPRSALGPLLLTCRRFSNIIYQTPTLWTCISARMIRPDIRRRLSLSKSVPLAMDFHEPEFTSPKLYPSVFRDVRPSIGRWQDVTIPILDNWDKFFKVPVDFSLLRQMTIGCGRNAEQQVFWGCSFPHLEMLNLISFKYLPSNAEFPSLRECEIQFSNKYSATEMYRLLTFLESVRSVEVLRIKIMALSRPDPEPIQLQARLCLPHLNDIALTDPYGFHSLQVLRNISIPTARKLSLESKLNTISVERISFDFQHPIEHLEIHEARISLAKILPCFPSLRKLGVQTDPNSTSLSSLWTSVDKRHCRSLENLQIDGIDEQGNNLHDVLGMLKSLRDLGVQLKKLEVSPVILNGQDKIRAALSETCVVFYRRQDEHKVTL